MKIRLSQTTAQLLETKARELGTTPESLASSLLEELANSYVPHSFEEYRSLTYGELRKLSLEGTPEQKVIANQLRTLFIR